MKNYWINTISADHVLKGVEGGFTQANHGSPRNLTKLQKGDFIIFYSPKTKLKNGDPLHKLTAIGTIVDDEVCQVKMTEDFHPFRRKVNFLNCNPISIRPLIHKLSFIKNKQRWGFSFMKGMFQIPEEDFKLIAEKMGVVLE